MTTPSLTDNPAASFTFDNITNAEVKAALETIRDAIVAAPNQQAAYAAAQALGKLSGSVARLS